MCRKIFISPLGESTGSDMKPCAKCVEKFGNPMCTHLGCCIFEEVDIDSQDEVFNSSVEVLNAAISS